MLSLKNSLSSKIIFSPDFLCPLIFIILLSVFSQIVRLLTLESEQSQKPPVIILPLVPPPSNVLYRRINFPPLDLWNELTTGRLAGEKVYKFIFYKHGGIMGDNVNIPKTHERFDSLATVLMAKREGNVGNLRENKGFKERWTCP